MSSAAQITVSTRKELYGRKVRRSESKTGEVVRAIVVDSHFIPDEGPHHPMRIILVVEDEESGLLLSWEIPGRMTKVSDWDGYPYKITFDKLDVDMTDLTSFGLDGAGNGMPGTTVGDLTALVERFNQKNEFDKRMAKGRVR